MALQWPDHRVLVTGGAGFLGRVVVEKLRARGCPPANIIVPRRAQYDLTREADVAQLYAAAKPDVVLHLAAEVGGIGANLDNPGRFFFANMAMALNLIEGFRLSALGSRLEPTADSRQPTAIAPKFIQVGTICAYPKHTPVPFKEGDLWNGYPEETNAPYGIAKKAALVMLDGYHRQYGIKSAYLLPVNLYGPHDNFDLHTSHVIPALIRKCVSAIDAGADHIACWGSGKVSREFLYVDDAAEGIVRAAEVMDEPIPINLGTGMEITIRDLVHLIAKLTGFKGEIRWDASKPDGQPRRQLDTTRAKKLLGWEAKVGFEEGLRRTIEWWRGVQASKCPNVQTSKG